MARRKTAFQICFPTCILEVTTFLATAKQFIAQSPIHLKNSKAEDIAIMTNKPTTTASITHELRRENRAKLLIFNTKVIKAVFLSAKLWGPAKLQLWCYVHFNKCGMAIDLLNFEVIVSALVESLYCRF